MISNRVRKFGLLAGGILVGCTFGAGMMFYILLGFNPPAITHDPVSKELTAAVDPGQIPENLVYAVLAAEDHRFYEHGGVDLRAVGRSLSVAKDHGVFVQGASTLSMQLAKNVVLADRSRTLGRKVKEAFVALQIERNYTKDEILASYLNNVYFVPRRPGVVEASRNFFGKTPDELSLEESVLIAGMAKAPGALSPWLQPHQALQRRNTVLTRMRVLNYISSDQELNELKARPLGLVSNQPLLT